MTARPRIATTVPAEYHHGTIAGQPGLTVTIDLTELGAGGKWHFDQVIHPGGGGKITLTFLPADDAKMAQEAEMRRLLGLAARAMVAREQQT